MDAEKAKAARTYHVAAELRADHNKFGRPSKKTGRTVIRLMRSRR
jgi:hypothetical protein